MENRMKIGRSQVRSLMLRFGLAQCRSRLNVARFMVPGKRCRAIAVWSRRWIVACDLTGRWLAMLSRTSWRWWYSCLRLLVAELLDGEGDMRHVYLEIIWSLIIVQEAWISTENEVFAKWSRRTSSKSISTCSWILNWRNLQLCQRNLDQRLPSNRSRKLVATAGGLRHVRQLYTIWSFPNTWLRVQ